MVLPIRLFLYPKREKTDDVDLVSNQYHGKEHLFPIYEKLISLVKNFGDDVKNHSEKD